MPNTTVAFSEEAGGWTSEFTFLPETGLSLNNNYYTANNGRLYRHNSQTEIRNRFYGMPGSTTIEFPFNENQTLVKNFQSINYEGLGDWEVNFQTNLESGNIPSGDFVIKEGERFGWIRGDDDIYEPDLATSASSGIGIMLSIVSTNVYEMEEVPSALSIGDAIFSGDLTTSEPPEMRGDPELVGLVSDKTATTITITSSGIPGLMNGLPTQLRVPKGGEYFIYVKNNQIEKSGIIGFYNVITMTNSSGGDAEIFAVNANSFISTR